ncbi:MAG: hypothetical protein ACXVQ3_10300 [Gaiellaceae bacterium]
MRGRLVAIASIAVLAAGCGSAGGGNSTGDAAALVPPDALAYLSVDTDFSSTQIKNAEAVLNKFPIKAKLLQQLRSSLAKSGTDVDALKASIGPEVDVAILKVNGETNAVGYTQPSDENAFVAQLDKEKTVHTKIDGWTVFSDKQPFLDAAKNRSGRLSDDVAYQAAMKTVPGTGDAIARVYASAAGTQTALGAASSSLGSAGSSLGTITAAKWIAGALTSQDGAFKLEVHAKAQSASSTAGAGLADEIPSGSILALSLTGGSGALPASLHQQLSGLSQQLGVDLASLVGALNGPVIAYVRAGLPLPEITIAAKPAQPEQAVQAVGQLIGKFAQGLGTPVPTKLDGGTLNKLDLGSLAIYYGVADGKLVVTDSANALAELKGSVGHLSGDSVFKEAKDGAGMPDQGQGFLFVDLKDALPAIEGFAQLASQNLPASVEANLKPLRSLLVFGSRDGDVQSFVAYLKTS